MYRWLRNTHLFTGLFSALFILMYGVSSVQMAHNRWFNLQPVTTETTVAIGPSSDARAIARELMDRHGATGEIQQIRLTGETIAFRIVRPGTVYEVETQRGSSQARLKKHVARFMGMMNRLHHISGAWREYTLMKCVGRVPGTRIHRTDRARADGNLPVVQPARRAYDRRDPAGGEPWVQSYPDGADPARLDYADDLRNPPINAAATCFPRSSASPYASRRSARVSP